MPLLPRALLAILRRVHYDVNLYNEVEETGAALSDECARRGLPKTGSKRWLHERITQYDIAVKCARRIQSLYRGVRVRNKYRALGALVPIEQCVNETDFFTMECLSKHPRNELHIHTSSDGKHYGFTWSSLRMLIDKEDPPRNPYTREIMPCGMGKLARLVEIPSAPRISLSMSRDKHLEHRAIDAFHNIDMLGFFTDHMWFWALNTRALTRWATVVSELWRFRLELSDQAKAGIFPPHARGNGPAFKKARGRNLDEVRAGALTVIEQLTDAADDIVAKRQGALLVLIGLCAVSQEASRALPVISDVL